MWPDFNIWVYELERFMQTGGWVLYVILTVCFLLATLIFERISFRVLTYRRLRKQLQAIMISDQNWRIKSDRITELQLAVNDSMSMIKTLIALCPLIGLIGTVTGMIQVFDSLAIYGTGNARLMASGVASATFPTMAGMAVAVAGLLFYGRLQQWVLQQSGQLQNFKSALRAQNRRRRV
ncbi:MAG: MotA/TolQ/ExbB proton channel family protein [Pseudomonadota bacterium]